MTNTQKDRTEMKTETICYGDCLEHLKRWVRWNKNLDDLPPSKADLIYLDPPWNSGRNYNVLFGKAEQSDNDSQTAQETAFRDMWQWDDRTAGVLVQRITNPTINDVEYLNHPALKSILALKTLLGESGMLAYCAYIADRLRKRNAVDCLRQLHPRKSKEERPRSSGERIVRANPLRL